MELDVAWLVHTVDIAKGGSDGEVGADGSKSGIHVVDIFGLGVERGVVDVLIVDTVFLTTSDTDFLSQVVNIGFSLLFVYCNLGLYHLEPLAHLCSTLKVLGSLMDVVVFGFFGQVNHVGREQRLAVLLKIFFISLQHAVEPWQ